MVARTHTTSLSTTKIRLHPQHTDTQEALTLGSITALFILSLIVMGLMPQNFFPSLDKPYFRADVFYPDGYSIREVETEMKKVEAHLMQQPEVKRVSVTFGSTPLRYYLASTSVRPQT